MMNNRLELQQYRLSQSPTRPQNPCSTSAILYRGRLQENVLHPKFSHITPKWLKSLGFVFSMAENTNRVEKNKLKQFFFKLKKNFFSLRERILTPPRSVFQVFLGNHRVFSFNLKSSCQRNIWGTIDYILNDKDGVNNFLRYFEFGGTPPFSYPDFPRVYYNENSVKFTVNRLKSLGFVFPMPENRITVEKTKI